MGIFGGIRQQQPWVHHNTQDRSCLLLHVLVTSITKQLLPGLPKLFPHKERREIIAVSELGTFTSFPLLAGKHLLTTRKPVLFMT